MSPFDRPQEPDESVSPLSSAPPTKSTVMPPSVLRQERQARDLILDYALGISVLGLIPVAGLFTVKLLIAAGLILKMMWDIAQLWNFQKGQDLLAVVGNLFGGIGAFAMAFTAWLTLFAIGIFVPYIKSFAFAAALFTLTWGIGQATRQFYTSGYGKESGNGEN